MSYSISYDEPAECMQVRIEGALDQTLFRSMAADVAQALKKNPCQNILNDLRKATLAVGFFETYEMPSQALTSGISRRVRRALVVEKSTPESEFLETVFVNQGNVVQLFSTMDAAKQWLNNPV